MVTKGTEGRKEALLPQPPPAGDLEASVEWHHALVQGLHHIRCSHDSMHDSRVHFPSHLDACLDCWLVSTVPSPTLADEYFFSFQL